jgi:hypothetical protein
MIKLPHFKFHWYSYISIVPPPPVGTRFATVVFLMEEGFIDYVRLEKRGSARGL